MEKCDEIGVDIFPAAICKGVFVCPLLSWYNAQFDIETSSGYGQKVVYTDVLAKWAMDPATQVWKYMMKLNDAHLDRPMPGTVASPAIQFINHW